MNTASNAIGMSVENTAENYAASEAPSLRQTATSWELLMRTVGGPRQWAGKLVRLSRTMRLYVDRREVRRRLERLQGLGFMETIPSGLQLAFGGLDMLRYFIEPGARDYYATRGINFAFHQLLRVLDDPVSMIDPVGILSERDTIIGHVLQVVHANPVYDLQLLDMFEDGLDELERQTQGMIDGSHPRAASIGAIVEDPEYHSRLLSYVREYRKSPATPQLRRKAGNARSSRDFVLAEETFGTMPGAMRYMARLPRSLGGLIGHYRSHRVINPEYCDRQVVDFVSEQFEG